MSEADIDLEQVEELARAIILKAKENRSLKEITKRKVRDQIEEELSLAAGSLQEHKGFLSRIIDEATSSARSKPDDPILPSKKSNSESSKVQRAEPSKPNKSHSSLPDSASSLKGGRENEITSSDNHQPNEVITTEKINDKSRKRSQPASESEMSSVVDEPAKKKRKKRSHKSAKESAVEAIPSKPSRKKDTKESSESPPSVVEDKPSKPQKKAKEQPDKVDDTVKKYKNLITACGVRKAWAKEFKDIPDTRGQIAHLRKILDELGMSSRGGLAEAKRIKERRELMADVEAVQEFNTRINEPRASRSKQRAEASSSSEAEEEVSKPKKRTTNIMDYLDSE